MRSDTDIQQWLPLKGRSVCLSEGSPYGGSLHVGYGAREEVVKAPADGLLALRIGHCDATVHDDGVLNQMLTLPEWEKFSASFAVVWAHDKSDMVVAPARSGYAKRYF
ncbi:MAG: hypothetical protein H7240_06650 [Glaciimonas sp.]|nr:hypothetical protein [Glaciimonas sp.]